MSHDADFLVIADPSWIEIQNATELIQASQMGEAGLRFALSEDAFTSIEPMLEDAGIMPYRKTITNARLIDAGPETMRFYVKYGDIPPDATV